MQHEADAQVPAPWVRHAPSCQLPQVHQGYQITSCLTSSCVSQPTFLSRLPMSSSPTCVMAKCRAAAESQAGLGGDEVGPGERKLGEQKHVPLGLLPPLHLGQRVNGCSRQGPNGQNGDMGSGLRNISALMSLATWMWNTAVGAACPHITVLLSVQTWLHLWSSFLLMASGREQRASSGPGVPATHM